jgi:hypothetical protein
MLEPRDLAGKTMLVTGANTGIGRATAVSLAHRGAHVFIACRSREKAEPVLAAILAQGGTAEIVKLDLADLASVRAAADAVLAKGQPLHVLINNAGLAGMRGETKQGFEIAFGTNHLGHFALTERLLPLLRETGTSDAPARIVNVSSKAHYDDPLLRDDGRAQGRGRTLLRRLQGKGAQRARPRRRATRRALEAIRGVGRNVVSSTPERTSRHPRRRCRRRGSPRPPWPPWRASTGSRSRP